MKQFVRFLNFQEYFEIVISSRMMKMQIQPKKKLSDL